MPITAPPLDLLPKTGLLIGDQRIDDASGGVFDHIYGANGKSTSEVPLAGPPKSTWRSQRARCAARLARHDPDQRRELMIRFAQSLLSTPTNS